MAWTDEHQRHRQSVPLTTSCDLFFEGMSRPVRFLNCAHLGDAVAAVFPALKITPGPISDATPVATLAFSGEMYRVTSPFEDKSKYLRDEVNALCDIAAILPYALANHRGDRLWIHAAAVRVAGRLILLPAIRRAGKSLLSTAMAARGADMFADDVVGVSARDGAPLEGYAAGVAPRIRLPLPDGLDPDLVDYISRRAAIENRQYRYLDIPDLPRIGTAAPFGAVLLLDRREDGDPELEPASRGDVLRRLLKHHFTRDRDSAAVMAALHELANSTNAWTFRYSDPDVAAAFLIDGAEQILADAALPQTVRIPQLSEPAAPGIGDFDAAPNRVWQRREAAMMHELDGDLFAVSADGGRIVHLDDGAQRIWRLLSEPISRADAVEILNVAFPDIAHTQIDSDVSLAFARLHRLGLIR